MALKTHIIYSFLFVIIFYNHGFCNSISLGFKHHDYIVEKLDSLNNQNNEDAQQHKLNIYVTLQNLNCVEDSKAGLTTKVFNCVLAGSVYSYYYPKSDYIFIRRLLLINKSPPAIS